jgi:hypothetical protein
VRRFSAADAQFAIVTILLLLLLRAGAEALH